MGILCCFQEDIQSFYINTLNSAMFENINLCFVLIAVSIAGNGMAKYLLVDVAEEKRISDEGAGKLLTEQDYGDHVSSYDKCEYAHCGCHNGCPEGKVCCPCGPCRRGNMCRESCGDECEVPAICKLL